MSFGYVSTAKSDRPFLRPTLLHIPIAVARVLHRTGNDVKSNPQREPRRPAQHSVILRARDEVSRPNRDAHPVPRPTSDVLLRPGLSDCHNTSGNAGRRLAIGNARLTRDGDSADGIRSTNCVTSVLEPGFSLDSRRSVSCNPSKPRNFV